MQNWQNLAERSNDGLVISLDFRALDSSFSSQNELRVRVSRDGSELFTLYPENENALQCFNHPYAFAYRALSAGKLDREPLFAA